MLVVAWIIGAIFGLGIGGMIAKNIEKNNCKHKWQLIESGKVFYKDRYGEKIVKGFIKVYQCEHCLKMRKEQVELD
jgi:hypothetical protein